MKNIIVITLLLLTANMAIQVTPLFAEEPFQVGISVVDITPLPGGRMSGYFRERINTGVSNPLLAKTIYFKQGDTKAALVFCDIIGIAPHVPPGVIKYIKTMTDIPEDNISIIATHSHTGPLYFGALRQHFHDKAIKEKGRDPYELLDYSQELVGRIVRGIIEAENNLKPTNIKAGYAVENNLSFNRRFHMKNGRVRFNPGTFNPDIVRVAGPIDPEIGIISFIQGDNKSPFGLLFSFALHLDTVGGTKHSADYPYFLQQSISKHIDKNTTSIFGTGTCGDINHVDVTQKNRRKAPEIGSILADTVIKKLPSLETIEKPSLAVLHKVLEVPLQQYSKEEIEQAFMDLENVGNRKVEFLKRVESYKIAALQSRKGKTIPLSIHAIRLSKDLAIVTLPGEVFVELGMQIKQSSPFKTTLVIELANDAPGYIPTRKAFAEGSYETVNSRVIPGSGEKMVEAAIQLLNEISK